MTEIELCSPPRHENGAALTNDKNVRYFGEPGGARTRDHRIKSAMLYQLSYRPGATAGETFFLKIACLLLFSRSRFAALLVAQ